MDILEKIENLLEAKSKNVDLIYDEGEFGIADKGKYTSIGKNEKDVDKFLSKKKASNQEGNPDNKDSISTMIKMAKKSGQVSIQLNEDKKGSESIKNISVKIPSFTIKFNGRVSDYTGASDITGDFFSIDTFDNNLQEVLEKVMGKAVIDQLQKSGTIDKKLKFESFGEWGSGWPKGFRFKK